MHDEAGTAHERILHILEERALALARPPEEESHDDGFEMIVVGCGSERYGIEMRWVQEMHPAGHVTPVPGAPEAFAGLINLRGVVHAVLDTARYLGLQGERSSDPEVVLVGSAHEPLGLLVDEVLGLERVTGEDLRPPLNASTSTRNAVTGLTTGMVPMIDVEAILDDLLLHDESREE